MRSDQLVERVVDCERDILIELGSAQGEQSKAQRQILAATNDRRECSKLLKRQQSQRKISHIVITEIHSVYQIAHYEAGRRDENG